ncbi:MAG: peroxiredoxin [Sphingomonas sp.]
MGGLSEGQPIPDVALVLGDGSTTTLRAYAGKPLVVYFYPKDDTPGCTREAQDFSAELAAFEAVGVAVIGVSKDPPAKHAKFVAKYGLTVPLATDGEDGALMAAFGVWVEKSMYGKTYMGIERATFLFDANGLLVRQWRKVKVPGHVVEVLAAARALSQ